jgi:hypothetical protein
VAPEVVLGALKVFPAPPRPEWMNLLAVGWGSVMEKRDGIFGLICWVLMVVMLGCLIFDIFIKEEVAVVEEYKYLTLE